MRPERPIRHSAISAPAPRTIKNPRPVSDLPNNANGVSNGAHADSCTPRAALCAGPSRLLRRALERHHLGQRIAICFVLYWVRIFAIGAGYHPVLFRIELFNQPGVSVPAGVSWRNQVPRKASCGGLPSIGITFAPDTEQDVHSPRHKASSYSHVGWIFCPPARRGRPRKVGRSSCLSRIDVATQIRVVLLSRLGLSAF